MKTVFIYGFEGVFEGEDEYTYGFPELHNRHKCMLFLSQASTKSDIELASMQCKKYGFSIESIRQGNPLNTDVLNTEKFKSFSTFYEEALEMGSSLIWYPNKQ